jgi:hypothetical protein
MARKATNRFKPVCLVYSAPYETDLSTKRAYAIELKSPNRTKVTAAFIGCDLAWDESGKPLVSATVSGTPVPPGALRVFQGRGMNSTKFTLDLPGESLVTKIEMVIDPKPIPYGKQSETKPCIRLTENSESLYIVEVELGPAPVFYNAFPDLNGVAEDGSHSVAPKGAKYMLPFACIFNPYATICELRNDRLHSPNCNP